MIPGRNTLKRATALVLASLLAACSSALNDLAPINQLGGADYRLQPGDELIVTVQDVQDAKGTYVVDGSGTISLPLLQDVKVSGLNLREVESAIASGYLTKGILNNPIVSVQPGELRPFYVIGEVNSPGEFEYRQGMTVLSALSAAGGYTYRALEGEVELVRSVDGREIRARAEENTLVQPGDRIRVHERWF